LKQVEKLPEAAGLDGTGLQRVEPLLCTRLHGLLLLLLLPLLLLLYGLTIWLQEAVIAWG
jgi:hypothetical protein